MKAQEYYDKYFADLKYNADYSNFDEVNEKLIKSAGDMFRDFSKEYREMYSKRKPKTFSGIVSIIKEQNDKWNSVATKVNAKFGEKVIKRNVIWNEVLCRTYPHLFQRKPEV